MIVNKIYSVLYISRVPDQNGASHACYIVEIHHSCRKPSICISEIQIQKKKKKKKNQNKKYCYPITNIRHQQLLLNPIIENSPAIHILPRHTCCLLPRFQQWRILWRTRALHMVNTNKMSPEWCLFTDLQECQVNVIYKKQIYKAASMWVAHIALTKIFIHVK